MARGGPTARLRRRTEAEDSEHSPSAADMDAEIDGGHPSCRRRWRDYNYQSDSATETQAQRRVARASPAAARACKLQQPGGRRSRARAARAVGARARGERRRDGGRDALRRARAARGAALDRERRARPVVRRRFGRARTKRSSTRKACGATGRTAADADAGGGTCCVCYDELDEAKGEGDAAFRSLASLPRLPGRHALAPPRGLAAHARASGAARRRLRPLGCPQQRCAGLLDVDAPASRHRSASRRCARPLSWPTLAARRDRKR